MARPGGRPSKFPEGQDQLIKLLCEKGCTDKEMAAAFGVSEVTFNNWKKARPDFFESLKNWKSAADAKVEKALYERATGYSCPETKVFNNGGEIVTQEVIKHYPPDTAAAFIWLQNRKPDEWRREPQGKPNGEPITVNIINPHADSAD